MQSARSVNSIFLSAVDQVAAGSGPHGVNGSETLPLGPLQKFFVVFIQILQETHGSPWNLKGTHGALMDSGELYPVLHCKYCKCLQYPFFHMFSISV